jgi:hypothetical protein
MSLFERCSRVDDDVVGFVVAIVVDDVSVLMLLRMLLLLLWLLLLFMWRRVWGFGFRVLILGRRNRLADELRVSSLLPQTRSREQRQPAAGVLQALMLAVA